MVKGSRALLCGGGAANAFVIRQALCEFLACPLSKQPLRYCEETRSLVSDAIGASYPVVDGVPRLVPQEAKLLDAPQSPAPGEDSVDKSS